MQFLQYGSHIDSLRFRKSKQQPPLVGSMDFIFGKITDPNAQIGRGRRLRKSKRPWYRIAAKCIRPQVLRAIDEHQKHWCDF
jgi:hypothetical protein